MALQDELRSITAVATAQPTPTSMRPPLQPLQPKQMGEVGRRPVSAPAVRAAPTSPGQQSDGSIGLGLGGSYGRVAHANSILDYDVLHGGVEGAATPANSQPSTPGVSGRGDNGSYRRPVVPSPMVPRAGTGAGAGVPSPGAGASAHARVPKLNPISNRDR